MSSTTTPALNDAPTLVVPGAWTAAASFDDVRNELRRRGHGTVVVDLPARARRFPQLDRGGLRAIDQVLEDAIGACSQPPILIGHSLGGLAALRASTRTHVTALVLLMPAPPAGMARSLLAGALRRPLNFVGLLGAAFSVRALSRITTAGPAGLHSATASPETLERARTYRTDESWAVLAALLLGSRERVEPTNVPTLVVGGSQDLMTPTPFVRRLAEQLQATYVELDVAHGFNEEPTYPIVLDAVSDFLHDVAAR